jgi:isoquinoline 1-oxidoreductase subunit alpha
MSITFQINGQPASVDVAEETPLLWVIRDEVGLKGTKFGCGIGMCGACTVHLEGRAIRSCITPVGAVEGAQITTIEGLDPQGRHPLQKAWIEAGTSMRLLSVRADHAGSVPAQGLPRPQ